MGFDRNMCLTCNDDHVQGDTGLTSPSGAKGVSCVRPKPMPAPGMIWSNSLKRLQLSFSDPIRPRIFIDHIYVVLSGGTKGRRRRILSDSTSKPYVINPIGLNSNSDGYQSQQERSLEEAEEPDLIINPSSALLDKPRTHLNIFFAELPNRENCSIKIKFTDYSLFKSSVDKLNYIQMLELSIDDIPVYTSGQEKTIE
jgi:hypothetical protein